MRPFAEQSIPCEPYLLLRRSDRIAGRPVPEKLWNLSRYSGLTRIFRNWMVAPGGWGI